MGSGYRFATHPKALILAAIGDIMGHGQSHRAQYLLPEPSETVAYLLLELSRVLSRIVLEPACLLSYALAVPLSRGMLSLAAVQAHPSQVPSTGIPWASWGDLLEIPEIGSKRNEH